MMRLLSAHPSPTVTWWRHRPELSRISRPQDAHTLIRLSLTRWPFRRPGRIEGRPVMSSRRARATPRTDRHGGEADCRTARRHSGAARGFDHRWRFPGRMDIAPPAPERRRDMLNQREITDRALGTLEAGFEKGREALETIIPMATRMIGPRRRHRSHRVPL